MTFPQRSIDQFHAKLRPSGDCLLYQGGVSVYGLCSYQCEHTGKRIRISAHRFSYILAFGHIPDGMFVLHQCDTPRCCNPSHLSLGTPMDNYLDMVEKDRHPFFKSKQRRKNLSRFKIDLFWIKRELRKKNQ